MIKLVQFLFIVAVPLVIVGGGLVAFFAVGALFEALEEPAELRRRVESAFRKPPRPARPTAPDHYYQPYWAGRGGTKPAA